jgi:tetratricopeptide (TPR) repeat protein
MRYSLAILSSALALAITRVAAEDDSVVQCQNDNPDVAIPACTSLIESGRVDVAALPRVLAQRAEAFARKFDYDRAIKDYNHAIKLRPEFWIAFDGRGLAHANRLNFELAIKDYDQSIKLRPDNARAFYHRGMAKFGLCDLDGADADIAKARELDPAIGNAVN